MIEELSQVGLYLVLLLAVLGVVQLITWTVTITRLILEKNKTEKNGRKNNN